MKLARQGNVRWTNPLDRMVQFNKLRAEGGV
jgi:hypothetical protein